MQKRTTVVAALVLLTMGRPAHAQTFGDGTHVVGIDIQPGIYRAPGGEWCQWFRLPDLSGDVGKALAYGIMVTKPTVEIVSTDKAFRAQNCGTWELFGGKPALSAAGAADTIAGSDDRNSKAAAASIVGLMVHAIALHKVMADLDQRNDRKLGAWFLSQVRIRYAEHEGWEDLATAGHQMIEVLMEDLEKRLSGER